MSMDVHYWPDFNDLLKFDIIIIIYISYYFDLAQKYYIFDQY